MSRRKQQIKSHAADGWAVIRYLPDSGPLPEDDMAAIDSWYHTPVGRAVAIEIAKDWAKRFPGWTIALVRAQRVWYAPNDVSRLRGVFTARQLFDVASGNHPGNNPVGAT